MNDEVPHLTKVVSFTNTTQWKERRSESGQRRKWEKKTRKQILKMYNTKKEKFSEIYTIRGNKSKSTCKVRDCTLYQLAM